MKPVPVLVELLRQRGCKITPQRRVIFETLSGDDSHPTAEEVYQRVLAVMPDISRTTVYNTLKELVELGEVTLLEDIRGGGSRYDTNPENHLHVYCMRCNALIDIMRDIEGLDFPPEEALGFRIVRRQVTLYGYCPDCQKVMLLQ
jgi:Fe2+ or Zn2+ uptake regulation protein